ncbi:MAG TPA: hypothetical protein VNI60_10825 [Pyrinomonadaceae bacterium]|nr:hypothetical protein [Pyrinomonadaceae bacterium]
MEKRQLDNKATVSRSRPLICWLSPSISRGAKIFGLQASLGWAFFSIISACVSALVFSFNGSWLQGGLAIFSYLHGCHHYYHFTIKHRTLIYTELNCAGAKILKVICRENRK